MGEFTNKIKEFVFLLFLLVTLGTLIACSSKKEDQKEVGSPAKGEKVQVASKVLELKKEPGETLTIKPLDTKPKAKEEVKEIAKEEVKTEIFEPKMIEEGLAVEMILDASGSMNGLLGVESKLNSVKTILKDLGDRWSKLKDPPIHLSLRVFGSKYIIDENRCEDSDLLFSTQQVDSSLLEKSLEKIEAKGNAPLAHALKEAGKDLKKENRDKVILLLTDGKDTCGQDPCVTAKELYEDSKIITHVIAFDITQADEPAIRCIAESSKGVYLLSRSREELASHLDEALSSTIPYNLRLKILVGGTPLPSTITIYKAGTKEIVKRESSLGIELLRIDPGSYDILVEYSDSISEKKPAKILKGVALTQTGKVEQELRFDLASVTLSAHDAKGNPAVTEYAFFKAGTKNKMAEFSSDGVVTTFFLEPGTFDIVAHKVAPDGGEMTLVEKNVAIALEEGFAKDFAFQTGIVILKGQTSLKQTLSLAYKITKRGDPANIVSEGVVEKTGGKVELPPGTYDISVIGKDPEFKTNPTGTLENITVEGGSIQEQLITLAVGQLNLKALKAGNEAAAVTFTVVDPKNMETVADIKSDTGNAAVTLSPGTYDVVATLISTLYTEGPKSRTSGIQVKQDETKEVTLRFTLGVLKLLGRNAKENYLPTLFTIYKGGTEEVVATAGPTSGWVPFDLNPGNYDIKGVNTQAKADTQPIVWQRNVDIAEGSLYVREIVFTNAKLRLIGRGTNNEIIPVEFKVYKYGHDRPLLSGITGDDWQSFDLNPDQYYIEASYHDPQSTQLLKKWVSLKVAENDFVEQELRF